LEVLSRTSTKGCIRLRSGQTPRDVSNDVLCSLYNRATSGHSTSKQRRLDVKPATITTFFKGVGNTSLSSSSDTARGGFDCTAKALTSNVSQTSRFKRRTNISRISVLKTVLSALTFLFRKKVQVQVVVATTRPLRSIGVKPL
jgi:hypothetical protein